MSSIEFVVTATSRSEQGKGASRRLRRKEALVPGIVYGGKEKPVLIAITQKLLTKLLENEKFYSHILTLNIDDKSEQVVLKALQRHPYKPVLLHVDFQRVNSDEAITMHVPLHFVGDNVAPGVKIDKGIVTRLRTEIEIRCLPVNLPEFILVDLSSLHAGESVHISQLNLPDTLTSTELSHGNDTALASIQIPRGVAAEETSAAAGAAAQSKGKEKTAEKK